jgi:hypothetical protein
LNDGNSFGNFVFPQVLKSGALFHRSQGMILHGLRI